MAGDTNAMSENIILKLNISKITPDRLYKGQTGNWVECVLIPTTKDKYGNDFMVVESITKEERLSGKRGVILGNAKIMKFEKKPVDNQKAESAGSDMTSLIDDGKPPF